MSTPITTRSPETAERDDQRDVRPSSGAFSPAQLVKNLPDAVRKLDPRELWHNPVMLIVEVGAALTTVLAIALSVGGGGGVGFTWAITVWLWLTVLFATLAE